MQHIIGISLQLTIIGISYPIVSTIGIQQFLNIFMPISCIGIILQHRVPPYMEHPIMHFIRAMPIIDVSILVPVIGIIAIQAWDMPIIARLPHYIVTGMSQFIIIAIISVLLRSWPMSTPITGIILYSMPSSIVSYRTLAIIIGMSTMGIIDMAAFISIDICMTFIVAVALVDEAGASTTGANSRQRRRTGKMPV